MFVLHGTMAAVRRRQPGKHLILGDVEPLSVSLRFLFLTILLAHVLFESPWKRKSRFPLAGVRFRPVEPLT